MGSTLTDLVGVKISIHRILKPISNMDEDSGSRVWKANTHKPWWICRWIMDGNKMCPPFFLTYQSKGKLAQKLEPVGLSALQ